MTLLTPLQPFTEVVHREAYDAISPLQPSLFVKGKTADYWS